MKISRVKTLVSVAALLVKSGLSLDAQNNKPNVILIMADDLGWGDTGFNGNTIIKTPNLDKMATEGIRFNRFYSASAVSSPTRASVLTGRNPNRMGVFNANVGILRPEEITLPELLKGEGYVTGHFGKWHLGTLNFTKKDANRGRQGNTKEYNPPKNHGYDEAFVTESKVPTWDPMKKPLGNASEKGWSFLKEGEAFTEYGTNYWDINGNNITNNLEGDDSRVIMDRVLPFIGKSLKDKKPFLSVVWFHAPHLPCVAGPSYADLYKNQSLEMQNYAGCITAMDEQIGRLRIYLQLMKADKNTIIFFCSDNGPETNTVGTAGIFKERKRSLHEGGIRVPGLMVWPAKIKTARIVNDACVTSDYLPTIADILEIDIRKIKYQLDGQSILPIIKEEQFTRLAPLYFMFGNQIAVNDSVYKLYFKKGSYQLFNIKKDPSEKTDLSTVNADILNKMKAIVPCRYQNLKNSFLGNEYGTESFDRLQQKWNEILLPAVDPVNE